MRILRCKACTLRRWLRVRDGTHQGEERQPWDSPPWAQARLPTRRRQLRLVAQLSAPKNMEMKRFQLKESQLAYSECFDCLKNRKSSENVHRGAKDRVGSASGDLQASQMDDRFRLDCAHKLLEASRIRDVAYRT